MLPYSAVSQYYSTFIMSTSHRRTPSVLSFVCLYIYGIALHGEPSTASRDDLPDKPNVILFVADDMGWGDLSSYGHPTQEYGAIDRLGQEGIRFTQWYAPALYCTPSRAAMLTGRLPVRSGMIGPGLPAFLETYTTGLPHEEVTVMEALQAQNYTTGMVGKWHLGINKYWRNDGYHLPNTHGFDFVGTFLPLSLMWECDTTQRLMKRPDRHSCSIYYNTTIVQQPIDLTRLTSTLVHDGEAFIHESHAKEQPFFLYFSFPQTHTAMMNDARFNGSSRRGQYGDQVNEMSWAVDEIMDTVKQLGIDRNTLTVFVSDHGPHKELCLHGGVTGMLKGGKGNFWEGGVRVPAIAHWPGVIEAGTVSMTLISSMDLFNTFIDFAGGEIPNDRHIDGKSIKDILLGQMPPSASVHDILFFFCDDIIMAVRYKQFKIHYRVYPLASEKELNQFCPGGFPRKNYYYHSFFCHAFVEVSPPLVYNLEEDPGEQYPLPIEDYATELAAADKLVTEYRQTLPQEPDRLFSLNYVQSSVRPCCNPPYCFCNYSGK